MTRQLGIVRNYDDLHAIMRARAEELELSRNAIDALSGLQSGYAAKVLASCPTKRLGPIAWGLMLPALAMTLIAIEDPEMLERIKRSERKRVNPQVRHSAAVLFKVSERHLRKIARIGGHNSRRYLSKRKRKSLARKAGKAGAAARWGE